MSTDKPADKPPEKPADKLTRIAVRHLYFNENFDLPGGSNQVSNLGVQTGLRTTPWKPDPEKAADSEPRHYLCSFIPAWQLFELTYRPGGNADVGPPWYIPTARILKWIAA